MYEIMRYYPDKETFDRVRSLHLEGGMGRLARAIGYYLIHPRGFFRDTSLDDRGLVFVLEKRENIAGILHEQIRKPGKKSEIRYFSVTQGGKT